MYIPNDLKQTAQKYALGKYIVNPVFTNNQALEHWIEQIDFEKFEADDYRMQLHSRKRNNLYSFYLPCMDKQVVLKVSQISKHYSWYRKLNLILVDLIKNYSLNAYYGAVALEKINVDSLKVIAHWTSKRQNRSSKSYLLYEKVQADMSVFDLCQQLREKNPNSNQLIEKISMSLASIIRNIHMHNLRHGDPHAGNFLIQSDVSDVHQLTSSNINQLKITLIDLDKVQFAQNESRWRKKVLDIRCIRRFRIPTIESLECLQHYLDRRPSFSERLILKFWMRGGFNIYKWIKASNKRN